jgi:hypothetical protein
MEQQEERFLVTVPINEGLEPTTFSVLAEDNSDITTAQELVFKVAREKDKHILAVLSSDADGRWRQLKGDFDKEQLDAIGAAIDAHYTENM